MLNFTGRETELKKIISAFNSLETSKVQWVSIVAESGLGKTRLITEFYKYFSIACQNEASKNKYWPKELSSNGLNLSLNPKFESFENHMVENLKNIGAVWWGVRFFGSDSRNLAEYGCGITESLNYLMFHIASLNHELAVKKNNKDVLEDLAKKVLSIASGGLSDLPTFIYELIQDSKKVISNKHKYLISDEAARIERDINDMIVRMISIVLEREFPFVLVLDDLQWIDVQSRNLLLQLIKTSVNKKLFIITTCLKKEWADLSLQELVNSFNDYGELSVIELNKIQKSSIIELISEKHPGVSSKNLDEISSYIDGNPLYLEQIIEAMNDNIHEYFIDGNPKNDLLSDFMQRLKTEPLDFIHTTEKRFKKLPQNVQRSLELCSSQGKIFNAKIANSVIKQLESNNKNIFNFDIEQELKKATQPFFIIENSSFSSNSYEFMTRYFWDAAFSRFYRSVNRDVILNETLKIIQKIDYLSISVVEKINLLTHLRKYAKEDEFNLLIKTIQICLSNKIYYQSLENYIELEKIFNHSSAKIQEIDYEEIGLTSIVFSLMSEFPLFLRNNFSNNSELHDGRTTIFENVTMTMLDKLDNVDSEINTSQLLEKYIKIAQYFKEVGNTVNEKRTYEIILRLIYKDFSEESEISLERLHYYSFFSAMKLELDLKTCQTHDEVAEVFTNSNANLQALREMGNSLFKRSNELLFDINVCTILLSRSFAYLKYSVEHIYEGSLTVGDSDFINYCSEVDYLGDWFASIRIGTGKGIDEVFSSFSPWQKISMLKSIDYSLKLACQNNFQISNVFLMEVWDISRFVIEQEVNGLSNPLPLLNASVDVFGSVIVLLNRNSENISEQDHSLSKYSKFKLIVLNDLNVDPLEFDNLYKKAISAIDFIIQSNRYGLSIIASRIWFEWVYVLTDDDTSSKNWNELYERAINLIDLSKEHLLLKNNFYSENFAEILKIVFGIIQDPSAKLDSIEKKINGLYLRYSGISPSLDKALKHLEDNYVYM